MKVYEVDGEQRPLLKVALMQAKDGEDELLGQGYVAIDGKWKDNEFDGESWGCIRIRRIRVSSSLTRCASDWIDLKLNGKYTGQLFLEMVGLTQSSTRTPKLTSLVPQTYYPATLPPVRQLLPPQSAQLTRTATGTCPETSLEARQAQQPSLSHAPARRQSLWPLQSLHSSSHSADAGLRTSVSRWRERS